MPYVSLAYRFLTCLIILSTLLLLNGVCVAQQTPFVIVTKTDGAVGFVEDSTMFEVGINVETFVDVFGPFEREGDPGTLSIDGERVPVLSLQYVSDGLEVVALPGGPVKWYRFYVDPLERDGMPISHVVTDAGINAGASLRQIFRIYGEPIRDVLYGRTSFRPYDERIVDYAAGNGLLRFKFYDGVLSLIEIRDQTGFPPSE